MSNSFETKYAKQIQSRASSHGFRISLSEARQYYLTTVAKVGEKPTEDEFHTILTAIANNRPDNHDLTVVQTNNQPSINQDFEQMSITTQQTSETPSTSTGMIHQERAQQPPQGQLAVTHNDIQQAVELQFGRENQETKQAILNYVAQDTYSTAQELQSALAKLRSMRLDILLKLISDYNAASKADESLLKTALCNASAQRLKETADFFDSFESQLIAMRSTFGL
jgi:small-conductance mechanosensitive channel